jgi:dienelactone hydrolase
VTSRPPLVVVALALGLIAPPPVAATLASQRVTFRTDDGVTLAATWYEPGHTAPAVILVHMLHRSRRDWDAVGSRLAAEGLGALAIDLRGHGESSGTIPGGDGGDYSSMLHDMTAARRYLATRGDVQAGRVGIAGASIGANLAALAAAGDPSVATLALLSPSLDYRGLHIDAAMKKYGERPALLVSSDDDPYATRTVHELQKAAEKARGGLRQVVLLSHAGHGTVMLGRDADLARTLVDWFRRTLL